MRFEKAKFRSLLALAKQWEKVTPDILLFTLLISPLTPYRKINLVLFGLNLL